MATSAPQPQGALTAQERAQRSVFVGNIPYEAGEDQLKEIFTQAGPVVSFRIVYDRETGKPKGYGFCEYQDVETAQSAMRNLNNYDFHGRPLRVGVAAGEQSKDDRSMQQALGGPMIESPYGDPVESEKAPEAISKAVASLPPEQMFELMKQMKMCIQNNPNEARNMLLQNPQLAYALLQAQIVMKIVDPNVALAMLHRQTEQIPPLVPSAGDGPRPQSQLLDFPGISASTSGMPPASSAPVTSLGGPRGPPPMSSGPAMSGRGPPPISSGPPTSMGGPGPMRGPRPEFGGPGGPGGRMPERGPVPMDQGPPPRGPPRPSGGLLGDRPGFAGDMGGGPPGRPGPPQDRFPQDRDLRVPPGGPGLPGLGGPPPSSMAGRGPPPSSQAGPPGGRDPRAERDPRSQRGGPGPMGPGPGGPPPGRPGPPSGGPGLGNSLAGLGNMGGGTGAPGQDQEKAALIMQVLQLSDEQIAMLPPDQRRSILILKEQIARSSSN